MSDRQGVLPKQPLFYVLASARFQPWMLLSQKIPEIQDELRDRFPVFNQIVIEPFGPPAATGGNEAGQSLANGAGPSAWAFHTADRTLGCQISRDQVVVHALRYTRFEDFAETIGFVLKAVEKHARQFDVGAIGIRYLDQIAPRAGESLDQYLPTAFLPQQLRAPGFEAIGGMSQTIYRTASGVLQARFWTGNGYVSVPDDLVPLYILTRDFTDPSALQLAKLEPNHGTLDSDSTWASASPERMNTSAIISKLRDLHAHANDFFRTACTEHAFKVWRGEA